MKQMYCWLALLLMVFGSIGCSKQLVPFETLEEAELTLAYGVEGAKASALSAALRKLEFVRLVQEGQADRSLTGSAQEGAFGVTLAQADGEAILDVTADSVEECLQKLQPALMNTYVLKTLSRARTQNQPFKVEVKTDRNPDDPYRATEFIQFQVKVEKPCYLTLLEVAPNGKINILFPNAFANQQQIEAGNWYVIPKADSPFKIQVDPYPGQAIVWAVGHEKKPLDLNALTGHRVEEAEGYLTLSHTESSMFLRKLFPVIFPSRSVVMGDPWATGYTLYRVE